ncbi:hypothetical protein [Pseudoprimorskyibacter insulae]|uniref:Uncharacterized protein n=1 Tax=Pseudoprimorskyibacter insulae TaxID=1695997 RepID=A0A2R8AQ46_9RHOB|nr:hypothetical protein [Pseudoprimorskyibacter insulae]SPF78100.1 hypothetical protein PRI8871_00691 [Pseudoprimorskyibacter insulae]
MNRAQILAKGHWTYFHEVEGLDTLSLIALSCMDSFLEYVTAQGAAAPSSGDIVLWATQRDDPVSAGQHLLDALRVCIPGFAEVGEKALAMLKTASPKAGPKMAPEQDSRSREAPVPAQASFWDPLASPAPTYMGRRRISVYPEELPEAWKAALLNAAFGRPGHGVVYSREILRRTREKLCQLAWSCRCAGHPIEISEVTVDRYQQDVIARRKSGKNGLRWATVRALIEEIHRFARFIGLHDTLISFLATRLRLLERRERQQKALKHFELARTGNTTNRILDMADGLLGAVPAIDCPKKRHRMRNAACILGIYPIVPLRNASASLVFGENLFWNNGEWTIDMKIQKTQARSPHHLVVPLHADHGKFVDAVLIGDANVDRIAEARAKALSDRQTLFALHDGTPVSETYIPRIFKTLTGNNFTTTRTMLHTDEAIENGDGGTSYAMASCHQVDWKIRKKYQLETLARSSVERRQQAGRIRRARLSDQIHENWQPLPAPAE